MYVPGTIMIVCTSNPMCQMRVNLSNGEFLIPFRTRYFQEMVRQKPFFLGADPAEGAFGETLGKCWGSVPIPTGLRTK